MTIAYKLLEKLGLMSPPPQDNSDDFALRLMRLQLREARISASSEQVRNQR